MGLGVRVGVFGVGQGAFIVATGWSGGGGAGAGGGRHGSGCGGGWVGCGCGGVAEHLVVKFRRGQLSHSMGRSGACFQGLELSENEK
mgnify:CR=1 FL=1